MEIEVTEPHACSVDLRLEILSRVPFFSMLPGRQIGEINLLFHERGYSPGETIAFEGDDASSLFVVADGIVKLLRHSWIGKTVMLDMLTPGEFFGSLSALEDETYPDTARAHTSACVLAIDAGDFRQVLDQYPVVAMSVLDIMAGRLKAAHEMIQQLSLYSVERRIAYILLKLGDKLGKRQEVGLLIQSPLSRDDLAEMAGTTTETASRVMSQFQKEGLIQSGRQWVAIVDQAGLEKAAE